MSAARLTTLVCFLLSEDGIESVHMCPNPRQPLASTSRNSWQASCPHAVPHIQLRNGNIPSGWRDTVRFIGINHDQKLLRLIQSLLGCRLTHMLSRRQCTFPFDPIVDPDRDPLLLNEKWAPSVISNTVQVFLESVHSSDLDFSPPCILIMDGLNVTHVQEFVCDPSSIRASSEITTSHVRKGCFYRHFLTASH
jgi:hypothetical protein